MTSEKRSAVVFGLCILLMIVPAVTFAGQWVVVNTFTDNFNRADVTWSQNIGPGWLHNQYVPPPDIFNRYGISGGKLLGCYDSGGFLVASNFMAGLYYFVDVDVQYYDLTISNPWGDSVNELFGNRQYGPTPPNNQNTDFLVWDFVAPYRTNSVGLQYGRVLLRCNNFNTFLFDTGHDYNPSTSPTNFVVNEWYHQTLQRSNNYARATVTGLNVNVDSGWINMDTNAPPVNTTNCYAGLALNTLNRGYMDNFALTTFKWLPKGTIINIH